MTPPRSHAARRLDLARDGCVSVAEAVRLLALSTSEVYRLMDRGKLPFVKLGRRRLVPRRGVEELLAANMTAD